MIILSHNQRRNRLGSFALRSIVFALIFSLVFCQPISYAQQASVSGLPKPGTMVDLSPAYVPVLIKGLKVHQDNALAMDFIVDTGNTGLKLDQANDKQELSKESKKLIKYFLAALTLPEKDVWVNLSPYEKDRIIPEALGQTEMGRDMLAEDYILKQITASLIYPEKGLGKDFWDKVYRQAYQKFGTTQVPVNTFNKVWIVADRATVYENKDTAFVINSHLKVMLEEDYLAMQKHSPTLTLPTKGEGINILGSQIVREIILPALEKEVNQGKNFANLRQIFNSLILAKWYKQTLKQALLNQVYSNKNKVAGVDVSDKAITRKIYAQYLQAYKKGVFNYIKEDIDQNTQQPLPRKYFSGGVVGDMALTVTHRPQDAAQATYPTGDYTLVAVSMDSVHRVAPNPGVTTNVTDEGEGLFGKEQEASARDAAMTSNSQSFSISEIETEVSKFGVTATDQYNEQLGRAITFLRKKNGWDKFKTAPMIEVVNTDKLGFRTKFHEKRNVIYLEQARINQLIEMKNRLVKKYGENGDLDIFARELIYTLDGGSQVERREGEFAYALERFPNQIIARFPSDKALPDQIMGRITDSLINIWNKRGNVDNEKVKALKAALGFDDQITVSKNVSSNTRTFYNDVLESTKDSLYKIGINVLNGVIDIKQTIRLGENDPQLNGTENIRAGMLAFAANPPTVAHTVIAMLKSMADNDFDVFFVTVTKGDYRKPALKATFPVRQAVTEELIKYLFAGLIKVAPPLKIINEEGKLVDDPGINGEEKIKEFFRLNKDAKSFSLGYVAGLDHYESFKHENAKLKFEEISEANKNDFEFYVRMPGYKDILTEYWDLMNENIPEKSRQFFVKLTDSPNPLDLLKDGAEFPVLDTVGKLFLIQDYLKKESLKGEIPGDSQVALINIGRAGESLGRHDILRGRIAKEVSIDGKQEYTLRPEDSIKVEGREQDQYSPLRVYINSGLIHQVSATLLRNGIDDLIGNREFNSDYLRAMHLEVLKMATDEYKDNDGKFVPIPGSLLFGGWLRTASVGLKEDERARFPREIETMIPSLRIALTNYRVTARQTLIFQVNTILYPLCDVINVDEFEENRSTVVQVRAHKQGDPEQSLKVITRFQQGWIVYFDHEGNSVSKGINTAPIFDSQLDPVFRNQLTRIINDFFIAFNDHSPVNNKIGYQVYNDDKNRDRAMYSHGGIDFNTNQMQLNVQKQGSGVGINFDPAMIKRFESGDFQGFVPVIINIRPITNIAPMLGLSQEDPALSKV